MPKPSPKFDLAAELRTNPPKAHKRTSLLEHPRVAEWLEQLLELRRQGLPITHRYIAEKLTKGARQEGIIPPNRTIPASTVQDYLWRLSRG